MKTPDTKVLEAAAVLAGTIQSSEEWHGMISAQQTAKEDANFAKMLARHKELYRAQRNAQAGGQGFGGKELLEMISLQGQIQRHEICVRQQEAGQAVVNLLQRANQVISENLGLDFASNASSRRGGCCG